MDIQITRRACISCFMPGASRSRILALVLGACLSLVQPMAGLHGDEPRISLANDDTLQFSHLGLDQGLQNLSISSIVQDRFGFIWMGTQNGLHRFDGKSFRIFENEPFDPTTLSHNLVQTLCLDKDVLWVGTYQGMDRLDLKTYRITRYEPQADNPSSISHPVVTTIFRDSSGRLWAGTLDGLNLLDDSVGGFRHFDAQPGIAGKLQNKIIRSVREDGKSRLWVATAGGLERLDPDTGDFVHYGKEKGLGADMVMCLLLDSKGRFWAGTWGGGLSLYDPETDTFSTLALPDQRVYCLGENFQGKIFAGTWGGGLHSIHAPEIAGKLGPDRTIFSYRNQRQDQSSLSNDTVYSLFSDAQGNFWVGTNGGGLDMFNPLHMRFRNYGTQNDIWGLMKPGRVMALAMDTQDNLLASVYNSGLAETNTQTGTVHIYRKEDPKAEIPDNIINDILVDKKGRTWIATNTGLAWKAAGSRKFTLFEKDPSGIHTLPDHIIYALHEDSTGTFWIGTYNHGLVRWNEDLHVWKEYNSRQPKGQALSADLISDIQEGPSGEIWVGTYGGLNRIDPRDDSVTVFLHTPEDPTSLSSNSIRQIYPDSRGQIWIATTGGGLNWLNSDGKTFTHLLKEDGLSNNSVTSLAEQPAGMLWIATRKGLDRLKLDLNEIIHIGTRDGLASEDFTSNIISRPDGRMVFGHSSGVSVMNESPLSLPHNKAPVSLTRIRAGSKDNNEKAQVMDTPHSLDRIHLGWTQSKLEIEFSLLDFGSGSNRHYTWKLDGLENTWSDPQPEGKAVYTNLPGGTYRFQYRGYTSSHDLAPAEGSIIIEIEAHPFNSPIAWLIYTILGLAATATLIRLCQTITKKLKRLKSLESPQTP